MNVYPNPSTDKLNIQFKKATSGVLQIVNKQGQSVFSDNIVLKKEYFINTALLPSGAYIITLKNDKGIAVSQKIVK